MKATAKAEQAKQTQFPRRHRSSILCWRSANSAYPIGIHRKVSPGVLESTYKQWDRVSVIEFYVLLTVQISAPCAEFHDRFQRLMCRRTLLPRRARRPRRTIVLGIMNGSDLCDLRRFFHTMDRVRFDTGSVHRNASHREAAQRRQRLAVDVSPRYRVRTDRKPRSDESERHELSRRDGPFVVHSGSPKRFEF